MVGIVPTGQVVVSAPGIEPNQLEFTPFAADQISISGSFDEAGARAFAARLRDG